MNQLDNKINQHFAGFENEPFIRKHVEEVNPDLREHS